jgi:hypothetical protein
MDRRAKRRGYRTLCEPRYSGEVSIGRTGLGRFGLYPDENKQTSRIATSDFIEPKTRSQTDKKTFGVVENIRWAKLSEST